MRGHGRAIAPTVPSRSTVPGAALDPLAPRGDDPCGRLESERSFAGTKVMYVCRHCAGDSRGSSVGPSIRCTDMSCMSSTDVPLRSVYFSSFFWPGRLLFFFFLAISSSWTFLSLTCSFSQTVTTVVQVGLICVGGALGNVRFLLPKARAGDGRLSNLPCTC